MLGLASLALAKLDFALMEGGSSSPPASPRPDGGPYHMVLWLRRGEPPTNPARVALLTTRSVLLMRRPPDGVMALRRGMHELYA